MSYAERGRAPLAEGTANAKVLGQKWTLCTWEERWQSEQGLLSEQVG